MVAKTCKKMGMVLEFKTWLMTKAMEYKRKKDPFDGVKADLFELPADADGMCNNSYFFGANGSDGHSLIMRVGKRNMPLCEIFVIYVTPEGHLYTSVKDHYPTDACPMKVECVEPEKHFKIWFEDELLDTETGKTLPCKYELDFHATLPIFDAMQHSDFRGMARAFARPKWNKQFFKEASGDTGVAKIKGEKIKTANIPQRHYEQAGHFTGKMILDGKEITIDMPGSRDHAYGKRDWNYMSDHIWIMATTEKGETFNFSLVDYPKVEGVFCGYSNIGLDHDESLIDYKIIEWDAADGKAPDKFVLDCTFTDSTSASGEKTVRVTAKRENNLYLTFQNCDPNQKTVFFFQEGVGEIDFGGVKARGSIEYGFNPDRSRWKIK